MKHEPVGVSTNVESTLEAQESWREGINYSEVCEENNKVETPPLRCGLLWLMAPLTVFDSDDTLVLKYLTLPVDSIYASTEALQTVDSACVLCTPSSDSQYMLGVEQ